jgi:uncharacterized tellurite resistance protein B-like protein
VGWLDWFRRSDAAGAPEGPRSDAVQVIAASLEARPPDEARYLAAFAYLLGRVAGADHAIGDDEAAVMTTLVQQEGGLSAEQAAIVSGLARSVSLTERGTQDYAVSQEFAAVSSEAQRIALLRCLFIVSAADEAIVTAEDNEIRQISIQLKVPHDAFVRARAAVRDKLAVLRPGGGIRPAADG